jgi:hypothetical protein
LTLRIHKEACGGGRIVLVASGTCSGAQALGALSEVALAAAYASARAGERGEPPTTMRVGLIVARAVWDGDVTAVARATPLSDRGWLLECELRDDGRQLLSVAFAFVPRT